MQSKKVRAAEEPLGPAHLKLPFPTSIRMLPQPRVQPPNSPSPPCPASTTSSSLPSQAEDPASWPPTMAVHQGPLGHCCPIHEHSDICDRCPGSRQDGGDLPHFKGEEPKTYRTFLFKGSDKARMTRGTSDTTSPFLLLLGARVLVLRHGAHGGTPGAVTGHQGG